MTTYSTSQEELLAPRARNSGSQLEGSCPKNFRPLTAKLALGYLNAEILPGTRATTTHYITSAATSSPNRHAISTATIVNFVIFAIFRWRKKNSGALFQETRACILIFMARFQRFFSWLRKEGVINLLNKHGVNLGLLWKIFAHFGSLFQQIAKWGNIHFIRHCLSLTVSLHKHPCSHQYADLSTPV